MQRIQECKVELEDIQNRLNKDLFNEDLIRKDKHLHKEIALQNDIEEKTLQQK